MSTRLHPGAPAAPRRRLPRLAALLALACSLALARPAAAQLWRAAYDLTGAELQAAFDTLSPGGWVPIELSAADDGRGVRHAAVWTHEPEITWRAWFGLTSAELQEKAEELAAQGFVPGQVSAYADGDQTRYSTLWRRESGVAWESRHDMRPDVFQRTFDDLTARGYVPSSIAGYTVGGEPRYAAVWRRRGGVTWEARHDLSEDEFQAYFDRLAPQGYVPMDVSVYTVHGEERFAAIWERVSGVSWESRHGLGLEGSVAFTRQQEARGYAPYLLVPYASGGATRYAGAWRYVARPVQRRDAAAETGLDRVPAGDRARRLDVAPVEQQTRVWCWLAVGEMLFRHYGLPNVNPAGNFQCGIIGRISDPRSPCGSNCFACVMPSGSNFGTLAMVSNYARLSAGRVFEYSEAGAISPAALIENIDAGRPVVAGISYHRRIASADAEHVALIVGYELRGGQLFLVVNDPFPYGPAENPFLRHGGTATAPNQYRIAYHDFRDRVFWHWSVFNIRM